MAVFIRTVGAGFRRTGRTRANEVRLDGKLIQISPWIKRGAVCSSGGPPLGSRMKIADGHHEWAGRFPRRLCLPAIFGGPQHPKHGFDDPVQDSRPRRRPVSGAHFKYAGGKDL